ncbi:MAG: hypothetical protein EB167_08985 [Nitrososphaeria archaeon]|nr:hypothetical protein [Nitrososphaeria archaeon]
MTLTTGNTAKVKLMVYENDGATELRHASIAISDYKDDKNQNDKVVISYNQDFTGAQSFDITDNNGLVKDVSVKATVLDQWRTEIVYSFKPVKPFDTSALVVELWDEERSSRSNVFLNAVKATGKDMTERPAIKSSNGWNCSTRCRLQTRTGISYSHNWLTSMRIPIHCRKTTSMGTG